VLREYAIRPSQFAKPNTLPVLDYYVQKIVLASDVSKD